jgi:TolB-like protein/Tfp pilus assembly protein PilF/predicted Ser/Thr protein kinase
MIGQTLGHHRILEKIGAGGMGVVYRARDEQLDRDVALKVLPAGALADDDSRKRFRKEALAIAKLSHPNIGVVHEFGTQDGLDFLVMEYIPGTTLTGRLAGGSIPETEAVALAVQITSALEEAHREGVIHRDLKPGNVVVTPKGQAKVLDFGLAKVLKQADDCSASETLSEVQAGAGTLPYMSPEQVRGEAVDSRSDIFALGGLLYEMVTGHRAFRGAPAARLIDAILHESPLPPRAMNARLSPELDHIILKCLEKDPENRYQSAKELSVDLRRLTARGSQSALTSLPSETAVWGRTARRTGYAAAALLALAIVLVGTNFGGWRARLLGGAAAPPIESLAVLPLANLSHDPEQDYFADGMTEALIANLAQVSALRVISRTSVMHYKGTDKTLPQIARDLDVDAVIEGTVQRSGNRVQVTAQLIRGQTDAPVWTKIYERDSRDVLMMQSELAQAIVGEIKVHLTPQEKQHLAKVRPINPDAYNAYLLGDYHSSKRNTAALDKAIKYFQEAIRIDPSYAQAYAGLANAYIERDIWGGLGIGKTADQIRANTLKALELDEELAEAHALLGQIHFQYDWDWQGAEAEYKRAIQLNPNFAGSYVRYAYFLQAMGRHTEALAAAHRAVELDPLSAANISDEGRILYRARQYENAVARYQRALELDPSYLPALGRIAEAYEQLGNYDEALAYVERLRRTASDPRLGLRPLARIYARMGKRREALDVLRTIERNGTPGSDDYALAVTYSALGDRDRAIAALERGVQTRSFLPFVFVDPQLDALRSDPRFQLLLRRAGLPSSQ